MFDIIKNIILEYVDVPEEEITVDTKFFADLQMDSIEVMGVICTIEEKLGVELLADDLKNINTIGDLIAHVEEKK